MTRSYRYRLNPSRTQATVLKEWLRLTRELYNAALQERRDAWRKQRIRITRYDQIRQLAAIRDVREEFKSVPIIVQRGTLRRIDEAFTGFFERCKRGDTPGFPRFKGRGQLESILIDDLGGKSPIVAGGKRIAIPLLGKLKFRYHRPIEGTPKMVCVKLASDNKWYVTLICVDVPTKPLPALATAVGVDVGLVTFAATSDGEMFENPRVLAAARIKLARAARRVSRRKKGSNRRTKASRLLALKHLRVANVRRENHITVARSLVSSYGQIFVENLNVAGLAKGILAKSVNDAAWGSFLHWLRVKAESAGREVIAVSPCGTSQTCSSCGNEVRKDLSVRVHSCSCGLVLDRDINAACNILRLGKSLRGAATPVRVRRRSEKLVAPR